MSSETIRYDLQPYEELYREATIRGKAESAHKLSRLLESLRYELENGKTVFMEYPSNTDEPLVMRQLFAPADLDRWIQQRFPRLGEF